MGQGGVTHKDMDNIHMNTTGKDKGGTGLETELVGRRNNKNKQKASNGGSRFTVLIDEEEDGVGAIRIQNTGSFNVGSTSKTKPKNKASTIRSTFEPVTVTTNKERRNPNVEVNMNQVPPISKGTTYSIHNNSITENHVNVFNSSTHHTQHSNRQNMESDHPPPPPPQFGVSQGVMIDTRPEGVLVSDSNVDRGPTDRWGAVERESAVNEEPHAHLGELHGGYGDRMREPDSLSEILRRRLDDAEMTDDTAKVRTFKDGKLKISGDGLLLVNEDGIAISGDVRNSWAGLLALQSLFVKEHNAICDALKKEYPSLEDEELYRHARLVTSAVIAKIQTIDWTVQLLKVKTDTLLAGLRSNWYGLLGKKFKDTFGHVGITLLSGIVGAKKPNDHGVPYSLTEEFVSVYRMHPLLPDSLLLRNIHGAPGPNKSPPLAKEIDMAELVGKKGVENLSKIGFTRQMLSMGHQPCGALELWNYPMWLRDLIPENVDGTGRSDRVDLAALENLTDDNEAVETLRQVYNDDVEELDLMHIDRIILISRLLHLRTNGEFCILRRRLEADRFFTSDFNEEVYTKKGLEWVNTTESLKDVLDRHYPGMSDKWINSTSAFTVWDAPPEPHNPIPLYLRVPHYWNKIHLVYIYLMAKSR
ncbi:hypothetical protein BUALT_Bualt03G0138100 [Buddleja alternifolia]|uniref:Alpha-dioxygenase n=1 Tax=Buddleja alternifolia TaxID=168488 RepID=A0AAV6XUQ1_9LAMI|nr:hypothetical protein BUALT_Bualt03G0138100 [Buddleja alternifolia]